ncbi:MAG: GlcG/HbpS family heme-binding protein [Acidimicrobiia bacterium]
MPESTRTRKTITLAAAEAVVRRAREEAENMGKAMVIAVTDESGNLVSFSRMDGAPLLSVDIAVDKAYTAIGFGIPTHQWHDFVKDDPPLAQGHSHIKRLVIFGGGYPLVVDGQIVGGIGVSGGHYSEDMKVAEAGVSAL